MATAAAAATATKTAKGGQSYGLPDVRPFAPLVTDPTWSARSQPFDHLCARVNADERTRIKAWNLWKYASQYLCNDDLSDGAVGPTPWFGCVLYITGHSAFRPNQLKMGSGHVTKTAISMTTLMQAIDMSPLEFFGKLAIFSNQVVLDAPMLGIADGDASNTSTGRETVQRHAMKMLTRIEVTTVLQKLFCTVFDDVFREQTGQMGPTQPASYAFRSKRHQIRDFAWVLFLYAKGSKLSMAFDLVLAHRLLLCVINYCYKNTRQTGIFGNPDYDLEDNTLKLLCQRHGPTATGADSKSAVDSDTLAVDVMTLSERVFKPFMVEVASAGVLLLDSNYLGAFMEDHLSRQQFGQFGIGVHHGEPKSLLDHNLRSLTGAYELLVLEQGVIDERAILEVADEQLSGALALASFRSPVASYKAVPKGRPTVIEHTVCTRIKWPISVNAVALLQNLTSTQPKSKAVPKSLVELCDTLGEAAPGTEWQAVLLQRLQKIKTKLSRTATEELPFWRASRALLRDRFELTCKLYWRTLQSVLARETVTGQVGNPATLKWLLQDDGFQLALIASCVEVVFFSCQMDQDKMKFPWVLKTLSVCPYEFQKVVELIVRAENGMSGTHVKHLYRCETAVVEHLAWQSSSLQWVGVTSLATKLQEPDVDPGLRVFIRKLHQVASLSLYGLCAALELSKDITDRASACVLHAFNEHTAIMWQRHVDQVIICAVYAAALVTLGGPKIKFIDIVNKYKDLPRARAAVCYEVHLRDGVAGDIVAFYNGFFLPAVGPFVQSVVSVKTSDLAKLAAPAAAAAAASPSAAASVDTPRMAPRTVSCTTSLTLSTLKNRPKGVETGGKRAHSMTYSVHSSSVQNLDEINRFVRDGKRKADDDRASGSPDDDSFHLSSPEDMADDDDDDDDSDSDRLADRPTKLPCVVAKLEDWVQAETAAAPPPPPPQQQQPGVADAPPAMHH